MKNNIFSLIVLILLVGLNVFLFDWSDQRVKDVYAEAVLSLPFKNSLSSNIYGQSKYSDQPLNIKPKIKASLPSVVPSSVNPKKMSPSINSSALKVPQKTSDNKSLDGKKNQSKRFSKLNDNSVTKDNVALKSQNSGFLIEDEPEVKDSSITKENTGFEIDENIVEDETASSAEEIIEEFRIFTSDEEKELKKDHPFLEELNKLGKNSKPFQIKENMNKILLEGDHNKIDSLIPFIQSSDAVLASNVSEILCLLNNAKAYPKIIQRIQSEKDISTIVKLYSHLANLFYDEVTDFLNQSFDLIEDRNVLAAILPGLIGRESPKVAKKVEGLVLTEDDLIHKAIWYHMLVSKGSDEAKVYAKEKINSDNIELKTLCVKILSFSRDKADLDFLVNNRKLMYKSLLLMEEYLKAKVLIGSAGYSGEERFDKMEELCENSEPIFSWLALYVAQYHMDAGQEWLTNFISRHPIEKQISYIRAKLILDPYLKPSEEEDKVDLKEVERQKRLKELSILKFSDNIKEYKIYINDIEVLVNQDAKLLIRPGKQKLTLVKEQNEGTIQLDLKKGQTYNCTIEEELPSAEVSNSLGSPLALVPFGEYIMGNNELGFNEHMVKITKSLYVGRYEITNKEFEVFKPGHRTLRDNRSDQDRQPVVMVSWDDAAAFCNWLSNKEGLNPCYDEFDGCNFQSNGYRLLTEAEWEYCSRGGIAGAKYPWGDQLTWKGTYFANFKTKEPQADGYKYTAPVGSYAENSFGLFDMAGNVSEWCWDWYSDDYVNQFDTLSAVEDPRGPEDGQLKVIRGGSWQSRNEIMCGFRGHAHISDASNFLGFRIARLVLPTIKIKVESLLI